MRILVCSFTTPGYAPNELVKYLDQTEHTYQLIQAPAKHERRFIPGVSHMGNIRQIGKEAIGDFDIAIAPEPAFVLALNELKKAGRIGCSVYWRLDYFPRKYPGPFNKAYQWLEQHALDTVDQVWSIADPELPHVAESLGRPAKHVPYLLLDRPHISLEKRDHSSFWMGPDLDGSRVEAAAGAKAAGISFVVADYGDAKLRMSESELHTHLDRTKVGIALYRPDRWKPIPTGARNPGPYRSSKYFCDSSRIRRFLAHGVPVVTTDVAPTYTTLNDYHAGSIITTCDPAQVRGGIEYCLERFEELSENAYRAAAAFTYPAWFESHDLI